MMFFHDAPFLQENRDTFDTVFQREFAGIYFEFGTEGRFVRGCDASEFRNLSHTCSTVYTLGVPLFAHLKRCAAIDSQKISMWKHAPYTFTFSVMGGDESGKSDHPGVNEQFADFPDASQVFRAYLFSAQQQGEVHPLLKLRLCLTLLEYLIDNSARFRPGPRDRWHAQN